MVAETLRKIESWLYGKGFALPAIRKLLAMQLMLCIIFVASGVFLSWFTVWPLVFGIGASLVAYNFWFLARFVQGNFSRNFTAKTLLRLVGGFNLRLILTGVVLFMLIVRLGVPLAPLFAGLTSLVAIIAIWGFSKLTGKPI